MDFLHNTQLSQDGLTSPGWDFCNLTMIHGCCGKPRARFHFSQVFFVKDEQGQAIVQVKYGDGDKSAQTSVKQERTPCSLKKLPYLHRSTWVSCCGRCFFLFSSFSLRSCKWCSNLPDALTTQMSSPWYTASKLKYSHTVDSVIYPETELLPETKNGILMSGSTDLEIVDQAGQQTILDIRKLGLDSAEKPWRPTF